MKPTNTIDEMLISESKIYLDGYHIDLSKYTARVTHIDDITASICFTSDETGQSIYVDDCYYDAIEILQADMHF